MNDNKLKLEICIPTYNRHEQLAFCLSSIYESLIKLEIGKRELIGIRIHNNSLYGLSEYDDLIKLFREKFEKLGIGGFYYSITGLNIGSPSNNYGVLLSSNSDYVWYLPDDDLSRLDSIGVIVNAIEKYRPALIVGGYKHNIGIDYSINSSDDLRIPFSDDSNSIHSVITEDKVNYFFKTNPVAAQNLVFNHSVLKNFLFKINLDGLINPFLPTFLSLICLKDDAPVLFFKYSIGLFRYNEPYSDWRHEWPSYALQVWPESVSRWVDLGLLDKKNPATRYYIHTLGYFRCRLHLLVWGTWKSKINIFIIIRYYPQDFLLMVLYSPIHCAKKFLLRILKHK